MKQTEQFDQWCLLELMGRQRIAGKVTERVIAGKGFLEIQVPQTAKNPAFTRFISPESLYAINPIDEKTAMYYVDSIQSAPIEAWNIDAVMQKVQQRQLASLKEAIDHVDEEEEMIEKEPDFDSEY